MTLGDELGKPFVILLGVITLVIALSIISEIFHFLSWILTLNIPDFMKKWILTNTFSLILLIIGIPTLIVTKVKRMW